MDVDAIVDILTIRIVDVVGLIPRQEQADCIWAASEHALAICLLCSGVSESDVVVETDVVIVDVVNILNAVVDVVSCVVDVDTSVAVVVVDRTAINESVSVVVVRAVLTENLYNQLVLSKRLTVLVG